MLVQDDARPAVLFDQSLLIGRERRRLEAAKNQPAIPEQLLARGRESELQFIGTDQIRIERREHELVEKVLAPVRFVPLIPGKAERL